jgi:hypothetical protein
MTQLRNRTREFGGNAEEKQGQKRGASRGRLVLQEKWGKGDVHRRFPGEEGGGWRRRN